MATKEEYIDVLNRMVEVYDNLDGCMSAINIFNEGVHLLEGLVNEHFKDNVETNFEHYKDEIIEVYIEDLAISKGEMRQCCEILCSECDFADENGHCIGNREIMKWLKQPYKKLPYKLSQFEFDLLNAYKNSGMRQCISNYGTLLEMYGKGHFKGIDTSTPIREILDNCKVV